MNLIGQSVGGRHTPGGARFGSLALKDMLAGFAA